MDYHCLGDNENRPVRWMALESLVNNEFSSASDVVSVWGFIFGWLGFFFFLLLTLCKYIFLTFFPFFSRTELITVICSEQHLCTCFVHLLFIADSSEVKQALLAWRNCHLHPVLLGSISRKGS